MRNNGPEAEDPTVDSLSGLNASLWGGLSALKAFDRMAVIQSCLRQTLVPEALLRASRKEGISASLRCKSL